MARGRWFVAFFLLTALALFIAFGPAAHADSPWTANVIIHDATGFGQSSPGLEVDTSGNAYAVWEDDRNGNSDIYFGYRPAGASWEASTSRVNDDAGSAGQYSPAIAVDTAGNAYAAWRDDRTSLNGDIFAGYRPAGGSWGASAQVNDDLGNAAQNYPAIAVNAAGNALALWYDTRQVTETIRASYRPSAGAGWGANEQVTDAVTRTCCRTKPAVALDSAGAAYAVWEDRRASPLNDDIYFSYRSADPGGAWGANERVNDDTPGGADHADPAVAVDAAGNAYAVWHDRRNGTDDDDIYFAYRPAGGSWSANVKVNEDTGLGRQILPAIAVDGAGHAYAVWKDTRRNPDDSAYEDIFFGFRPAGGGWQTGQQRVNDNANICCRDSASVGVDSSGNVYAAWRDSRAGGGNYDIYSSYLPRWRLYFPLALKTYAGGW